jgi:glycosyltransferase involved in cell wall biosynthesis
MRPVTHIITTIDRGGAEKQLLVLVREQISNGRKVTIVPLKGSNELQQDFYDLGASIDDRLRNRNFILQIILFWYVGAASTEILHAHLPRAELLISIAKKKRKFIISKHVTEKFTGPKKSFGLAKPLGRFVTSRANHFIAISSAVLEFMLGIGELSPTKDSSIVYYGFDPKVILKSPSEQSKQLVKLVKSDSLVIGSISRLVPQKDLFTLIRAFSIIQRQIPDAELKILGRGFQKMELLNYCNSYLQDCSKVTWIDHEPLVFDFLSSLDVFVLTSKYEGFGLVLLEAMQAGIPIVASNIAPIKEVLGQDFPNLCHIGDENEFAKKIMSCQDTRNVTKFLTLQNQRLGLFNPQLMYQRIEEIYIKVYS